MDEPHILHHNSFKVLNTSGMLNSNLHPQKPSALIFPHLPLIFVTSQAATISANAMASWEPFGNGTGAGAAAARGPGAPGAPGRDESAGYEQLPILAAENGLEIPADRLSEPW